MDSAITLTSRMSMIFLSRYGDKEEWAADMWRAGGDSPGFMPGRPKRIVYSIIKLFHTLTSTPFHRVGSSAIDYFFFRNMQLHYR